MTSLAASVVAIALVSGGAAQAKPAKPKTTTTEIRGSYINNVGCVPTDVRPHADDPTKLDDSCDLGSTYTGGLVGHTAGYMTLTVDTLSGDASGTFDEWFYGTYTGDSGSYGGLHYVGSFFLDGATNTLGGGPARLSAAPARSRVPAGRCASTARTCTAGSSGS